eukprot:TRINITY_DN2138_c0_g1_i1.p1 TRINITY_DN2138_c0_g1~~TRINITY_DN2138_c0_g1_i1.p1  ORF type:complete len:321 (-),score=57.21 TRINITY_DN2138_c0_g1_i1:310-1272(-)
MTISRSMATLVPRNVVFLQQNPTPLWSLPYLKPSKLNHCLSTTQVSSRSVSVNSKRSVDKHSTEFHASVNANARTSRVQRTHIAESLECSFEQPDNVNQILSFLGRNAFVGLLALAPLAADPEEAYAIGGEYGVLEGRSASLIHPIVMGGLFLFTIWTGYLGWQWRRVRTIQDEINELKKQVKPKSSEEGEHSLPPSAAEAKIQQLTEERKNLLKGSYRDRHFNSGSVLLAFGVFEAIAGCFNTWLRTGKLFPGPHLFAGAGITILWAWAAALVPAMQKGNEVARSLHIALNAVNVLLFIWQIPTGFDIVFKVLEFTKWP